MFDYQRVRKLRIHLGLSENKFAQSIGVSQTSYNRYEKGIGKLDQDAICEILRNYKIDSNWLFFGEGGEGPVFVGETKPTENETILNLQAALLTLQKDLLSVTTELKNAYKKALDRGDNSS
jgi:transcriptional regulator with XRE-family HTH domain